MILGDNPAAVKVCGEEMSLTTINKFGFIMASDAKPPHKHQHNEILSHECLL